MRELSVQYHLQAQALRARLREIRTEGARTGDSMDVYLFRRRVDMLREMWRETRDTAELLEHYYSRGHPKA